jgi:hypothetical protein
VTNTVPLAYGHAATRQVTGRSAFLKNAPAIRPALTIILGVAALGIVAGCRGDGSEHYSLSASKRCFVQGGDLVRRDTDNDPKASGGWLRVDYSDYSVFIAFAADEKEAKRVREKIAEDGLLSPPFQKTQAVRRGNAVYFSNRGEMPSDMREKVEACLVSA